jgi:protein-disulfide isomerase
VKRLLALAALVCCVAATTPKPIGVDEDMALGSARAKVTVIEYASAGCSHCGDWAREVFPALKQKYIDTGKVRFVLKEMLAGDPNLAAAGFLLARCSGRDHYFEVVHDVYEQQNAIWSGDALKILKGIGAKAGVDDKRFDACLDDQAALEALKQRVGRAVKEGGVSSTPTFRIGDDLLEGEQPLATIETAIAKARKPKAHAKR